MRPTIIVPRAPRNFVHRGLKGGIEVMGVWDIEHWRAGRMIHQQTVKNLITNEGLNHLLNVLVRGTTQVNPWYVGIFSGDHTPAAGNIGDTWSSVATESTAYTESTRPEYNEAAAASQSITNSANKAVFTMSGGATIFGAALIASSVKGGGSDSASTVLLAITRFATSRVVIAADVLNVTYTLTAASA